jgi:hypothetical protein
MTRERDTTHAPLPRRWVDLIMYLDKQERKHAERAQAETERPDRPQSTAYRSQRRELASCATTQSTARGNPMINASQIKEHMEVKGSDGKHVGTVLGVENRCLKLASGGMDHDIDLGMVDAINNDTVRLRKTAADTVRAWH